jgi:sugar phosphate permease
VPQWFTPRQVPLVTQLTGICGQLGQVLSAVPFLTVLVESGWTTAYISVAALGLLSVVLVLALVRDAPRHVRVHREKLNLRDTLASVRTVWLRPGTRLGFFTHMGSQFSVTVFALMWGVPYLTVAQGMSAGMAGSLLSISVASAIASGIVIGLLTARFPLRRSRMVLAIIASNAAIWTVVLALPVRSPSWLLLVLVVVISVGGPGSMVGFDFARTFNPSTTLGTAQGMVNMGGFIASLLVMQTMGMILEAAGGYSFASFRLAWTVQYAVWVLAVIGILITRRKARRVMESAQESRYLLEGFDGSSGDSPADRGQTTAT